MALLRRLHGQMVAVHSQLVKAMQVGMPGYAELCFVALGPAASSRLGPPACARLLALTRPPSHLTTSSGFCLPLLQPGAAPVQQQAPAATAAAAPAKGGEPRPSNSNAENEPAAANTDSMEVDPPAPATTAAALPAGAPAPLGRAAAGSQGAKRKARTPKSKRQATPDSGDSDGDWCVAWEGGWGRHRGSVCLQQSCVAAPGSMLH